jgi:hydroxypyruvate reductase
MLEAVAAVIDDGVAVLSSHSSDVPRWSGRIDAFRGGHPAPDAGSLAAAERALAVADASRSSGGLLVLLSGGASAMLAAPADTVPLPDTVDVARRLMDAGAAIHELNCVRKHLSRIKGGRLGAAAAGRTITLALSDVHGPVADDPSVIGSGPTVADDTTFHDALEVLHARGVAAPGSVAAHLARGARGEIGETIKPRDRRLQESSYLVIGNKDTAIAGARAAAMQAGYEVIVLPAATSGEARETGPAFVGEAMRRIAGLARPVCVIAAGETTVTVRGHGRGGRNQEFALAAAVPLAGSATPVALGSVGTDGIDGPTDAAGAVVDSGTLDRARATALDWQRHLDENDAYRFFEGLDDLVRWGPTGTNVGDLHVLVRG